MAYQIEIEADFDPEPFCDAFGNRSIRFMIGHDVAADLAVFMVVEFTAEIVAPDSGIYDLRFGLEEQELKRSGWSKGGMDYSFEQVNRYIPKENRHEVLTLLLRAVECILASCAVLKVTMQSFYSNIPNKALPKYNAICERMAACGFPTTLNEKDGTSGKHYWLFVKHED